MEPDEAAWIEAAERHERALALLEADRTAEAEGLAEQAEAALRAVVGADHPDRANALATLAEVRARRGRLEEATALLREAIAACEAWRGEPEVDPIRWRALALTAEALTRLARYAEAEAALDALDAELVEPAARLEAANLRGILYRFQGRWDEARALYLRALDGASAEQHPAILHNLSGLASARGHFEEAEGWSRRALTAHGRRWSRQRATDLAGLGDALSGQGRHREAIPFYRRAIRAFTGRDAEDPEIAYAQHNLGDALAATRRQAAAERAYQDSLARKARIFGEVHPEIAGTLANLAALAVDRGRPAEAQAPLARALEMVRDLDAGHPIRVGVEALARGLRG